jgi:hypothetical protein
MKHCSMYLDPKNLFVSTSASTVEVIPSDSGSLKKWVKANHLKGASAHATLHPDDYQLFLLDRPNVAEKEMISALRWQVRSWISFPVKETAIQYFAVPTEERRAPKIYVCVANLEKIKQWNNQCQEADLKLTQLNIVELALSQLFNPFTLPSNYCGILFQKEKELELLVLHQNQLVFIRKFSTSLSSPEEVTKALQESFLYCQGQKKELTIKLFLHSSLNPFLPFLREKHPEFSTEIFLKGTPTEAFSIEQLISISAWINQDRSHAEH